MEGRCQFPMQAISCDIPPEQEYLGLYGILKLLEVDRLLVQERPN